MVEIFDDLEKRIGLGPTKVCRVLGYPYATYAQYKNQTRKIKPYLRQHIRGIMLLPDDALKILIDEVFPNGD